MNVSRQFSLLSTEICNSIIDKEFSKGTINSLIDELNAKPFKNELFVTKQDATALITALCENIKPVDEFLAAKTSHLFNSVITKQNIQFTSEYLSTVIAWHIECLKICSDIILPDILHNMQCILQCNPQCGSKFINKLVGNQGILVNIVDVDKSHSWSTQNPQQICLIALKCIICLLTIDENKDADQAVISLEIKEIISEVVVKYLIKGYTKTQDEFLYCKVVISALRVLTYIYFNDQNVNMPTPDVTGICRYFILYGLVSQGHKPERIMPAQQTIAADPVKTDQKGGKKQKQRRHRNNAIESLKKEIPVSDRSLMKDVDNFENNSAYKPASNYLELPKTKTSWALTSDSDMSDIESTREAKLIALKSRVRQSAANLFLVLFKVKEKREIFGYWWALLPDTPDVNHWLADANAKKTLAYCAVSDPIASSRAAALSVILALLSGSKMYLTQAESSKKVHTSFIPFSISLGYITTCMHKVLVEVLDNERSHMVILVALKCCAALVQATPYHKMQEGLITDIIRSTRKFLVNRDVTLQVGSLITMGCVLSIDPKVAELLEALKKDTVSPKINGISPIEKDSDDFDDFEEGYSDDEMFCTVESQLVNRKQDQENIEDIYNFNSWILDVCFKNMGWIFKDNKKIKCLPCAIPVMLESLQVLSAIAFHHLADLLKRHLMLLGDILSEVLQHEHQDVVVQAAKTISIIGDAIQKLEQQIDESPPLNHCVYMWGKLLTPLSSVLQCHESSPAKMVVCDCIANIGERSFKELPSRTQVMCCALLVGSCSDDDATVRAAAVRALAMTVMYRTLREDICFVTDCGENILRALVEPSLVVRAKAAWALGNLSGALVLNLEERDADNIDDNLLLRLLEVSIQCANDNDKVKMSATRSLGNLLRLIKNENLERKPQLKALCEMAIDKLLDCACKVTNMKVRWNACYALGNAMKNDDLFTCFNGWQDRVFESLCSLSQECKNFKVRINAATALRSCGARAHYGRQLAHVWGALAGALDAAAHLHDYTEYRHRDNLIEQVPRIEARNLLIDNRVTYATFKAKYQLCVTLAHICCLLRPSDLADIVDPLVFHFDCLKSLYTQLYHKLPPENSSCLKILQAAKYVTVDLTSDSETQSQALGMLQDIFVWDM